MGMSKERETCILLFKFVYKEGETFCHVLRLAHRDSAPSSLHKCVCKPTISAAEDHGGARPWHTSCTSPVTLLLNFTYGVWGSVVRTN